MLEIFSQVKQNIFFIFFLTSASWLVYSGMITDEIILQELEQARQEAIVKFPEQEWKLLTVRFEIKDRVSFMGCYKYSVNSITISRIYFKDSLENMLNLRDTIRHEFAHAVSPVSEGHGRIWKKNARILGAKPSRCGSMPPVTSLLCDAQCCRCKTPIKITKRQYSKMKKGTVPYICSRQCPAIVSKKPQKSP